MFIDVAKFIVENVTGNHPNEQEQNSSKKRKLNAGQAAADSAADKIMYETWDQDSWAAFPDISFSIPQRKKLRLEIGDSSDQGLRARNGLTDDFEFAIRWKDIRGFSHTVL